MPSASSLFLLFSISEKLLLEIFSELDNNLRGFFMRQKEAEDQRAAWGGTQGPGRPLAAAPQGTACGTRPGALGTVSAPLDAYKITKTLKRLGR